MLDGEKDIIKGAIKGEASAFGQLYDFYQPRIYRFILIKVGQREEAEDLTHQVFLSAWQNVKKYRDCGFPFSSWLYRIARNAVIDYYRRQRDTVSLEDTHEKYFAATVRSDARAEINIELEQAMAAIRKLKPDYQDVVIMRFIEELSTKEVAAALKKSEGAVKLIQHRALRQLKKLLS